MKRPSIVLGALLALGCSKTPHASSYPLQQSVFDANGGTLTDSISGARLDISQQALGSSQPILLNASAPIAAPSGFLQVGTCIRVGPAAFGFPVPSRLQVPFDASRLPAGKTAADVCVLYQDTFFDPPIPLSAQGPHAFYVAPVSSTTSTLSLLILQTGLYEAVIPPVPPPSIASLSPGSGPIAGGTTVTITGTGFEGAAKVTVNGVPQDDVQVVSPTRITYVSTPGPAIAADVRVENPDGGRGEKYAAFVYQP